jgi:hypothetical protein
VLNIWGSRDRLVGITTASWLDGLGLIFSRGKIILFAVS